ncbi:hypothetical protein [Streptomyces hokutonensis]|uniref:hypothetical protein n=1 Tax=Streptomyces hokutonensis TaxID=1306990 RepID=UPI00036E3095|nr:hypothetical protein [Streptomyces hokutonensis]
MSAENRLRLDDNRIRHLELIQTIVARMGNNSFLIKGWSLTVTGALLAYAAGNGKSSVAVVSFVPVLAFWLLDAYFLYQERLFRRLYDRVRRPENPIEPFAMNLAPGQESAGVLKAAVSPTLAFFYGGLALGLVFALVFVL